MCQACGELKLSRRGLLGAGAALAAAAAFGAAPSFAQSPPNGISPDEALQRLVEGNGRYVAGTSTNKDYSAGRAARAQGQYPFASILSCADSRVAPELIFDRGPGELFVVRVAGNIVAEDGLASLEYGASFLNAPLIVVLGHSACGAVGAAIKVVKDNVQLPGHLPGLIGAIKPAVEAAAAGNPSDMLAAATIENVKLGVKRLSGATPILSEMVSAGKVKVVGGVYDIGTGKVNLV